MSRQARIALIVGAIALAGVLFLVLRPGDDDSSTRVATAPAQTTTAQEPKPEPKPKPDPEPKPETIVFKGGEVKGGVRDLEFEKGGTIEFVVTSDVAEEVHLHGYDVSMDVSAGGKVEFDVPAKLEGKFEVEMEHSLTPIAEVSVVPG